MGLKRLFLTNFGMHPLFVDAFFFEKLFYEVTMKKY